MLFWVLGRSYGLKLLKIFMKIAFSAKIPVQLDIALMYILRYYVDS